jgi:hypothetical protein
MPASSARPRLPGVSITRPAASTARRRTSGCADCSTLASIASSHLRVSSIIRMAAIVSMSALESGRLARAVETERL